MKRALCLAAALILLAAPAFAMPPRGSAATDTGIGAPTISAPDANVGTTVTLSNLPAGATVEWMCDSSVQAGQTATTFVIPSGCASALLVTARIKLASAVGPVPGVPSATFDLSVPGNGMALLILL